jgi:hypothetical protein
MNNNSNLTNAYEDILLSEGKKRGEAAKKVTHSKDNVVARKFDIGNGKDKKLVGDGPSKAKLRHKPTDKKKFTTDSYNSFEALFRSTLLEDEELQGAKPTNNVNMDFQVPTSGEEMTDEIENTQDEVSDLVSDLRSVVDSLNDILNKIDDAQGAEEEEPTEGEEEVKDEETTETENETENEQAPSNKVKESVEDHGVPLKNMKSGTGFNTKQKYVVKSNLKPKSALGQYIKRKAEPELKKLNVSHTDLQNTKNQKVKTSSIKPGEFFK